jgi:hypothetical protein
MRPRYFLCPKKNVRPSLLSIHYKFFKKAQVYAGLFYILLKSEAKFRIFKVILMLDLRFFGIGI